MVLGGLFAFFNFRAVAGKEARDEAKKIAKEVAEQVANEHMQKELPNIIRAYQAMIPGDDTDEEADSFAEVQERGEGDNEPGG